LLSNNPRLRPPTGSGLAGSSFAPSTPQALRAGSRDEHSFFFFDGSPLEVLLAGRQFVHSGWRLLHHPLYGNFRPHQQPYRSLLLQAGLDATTTDDGLTRIVPDEMSLRLLEEALALYQNAARVLSPAQAPPALQEACALLDRELMLLPLDQAGWTLGDQAA
jgi:hypothetical protein